MFSNNKRSKLSLLVAFIYMLIALVINTFIMKDYSNENLLWTILMYFSLPGSILGMGFAIVGGPLFSIIGYFISFMIIKLLVELLIFNKMST